MSRVGKRPISIPSGLSVSVEGSKIVFKNSKLVKELETHNRVVIECSEQELSFKPINDEAQSRAFWGTYRALA